MIPEIYSGEYDDRLKEIIAAAFDRQRTLKKIRAANLAVGDIVKTDGVTPKYLDQQTIQIVGLDGDSLTAKPYDWPPALRRRAARYINPENGTLSLKRTAVRPYVRAPGRFDG